MSGPAATLGDVWIRLPREVLGPMFALCFKDDEVAEAVEGLVRRHIVSEAVRRLDEKTRVHNLKRARIQKA
jgi:hypothetical protein